MCCSASECFTYSFVLAATVVPLPCVLPQSIANLVFWKTHTSVACNLYVVIIKKNMRQMRSFTFIFYTLLLCYFMYLKNKNISYTYIKKRIQTRSLIYDTTTWWFVNNNTVLVLLTQNTEFPIGIDLAAVHRIRQESTKMWIIKNKTIHYELQDNWIWSLFICDLQDAPNYKYRQYSFWALVSSLSSPHC